MVRRVIRVLELPVSLSVGVLRESASLAGRVVGRLLVGGRPSEPPAPPPPAPPAKPAPRRREQGPRRERGQARPKPARPAPARVARKRPAAERGNGTERPEAPASAPEEPAPLTQPTGGEQPAQEPEAAKPEPSAPQVTEPSAPQVAEPSAPPVAEPSAPPVAEPSAPQVAEPASPEPESASPDPVGDVEHEPGIGTSVRAQEPHSALNTPIGEPDPTEWPDPYDKREDPRDIPAGEEMVFGADAHPPTGATSTSEPHPNQDPEAEPWEGPKRDKVDR
jgi:hypothetical protein